MKRRGRRRKAGQRYPGGQLKREQEAQDFAASMPHRKKLKAEDVTSQLGESALGRLRLEEKISQQQYDAGNDYFKLWIKYLATLAAPRWSPRTNGGESLLCAACVNGRIDECPCNIVKRKFLQKYDALRRQGWEVVKHVTRVVLYDEEPPVIHHGEPGKYLLPLLLGLDALTSSTNRTNEMQTPTTASSPTWPIGSKAQSSARARFIVR